MYKSYLIQGIVLWVIGMSCLGFAVGWLIIGAKEPGDIGAKVPLLILHGLFMALGASRIRKAVRINR